MLEKIITGLTFEDAQTIESEMEPITAPEGSVIVAQDDVDADMYVLVSGTYEVYQKAQLCGKWCALHLATIDNVPTVIGEMNLLRKTQRNASIFVREEGKVLKLEAARFEALKAGNPFLAMRLLEYAGQTVSQRFTQLQNSVHEKIINEADTPHIAYKQLEKAIGKVTFCSDALAEKLFGINQPKI